MNQMLSTQFNLINIDVSIFLDELFTSLQNVVFNDYIPNYSYYNFTVYNIVYNKTKMESDLEKNCVSLKGISFLHRVDVTEEKRTLYNEGFIDVGKLIFGYGEVKVEDVEYEFASFRDRDLGMTMVGIIMEKLDNITREYYFKDS